MKIRLIITMLIFLLAGCSTEQKEIPIIVLVSPQLSAQGNVVEWSSVENAVKYELKINERYLQLPVSQTSFNVASSGYGEYEVMVRALGGHGYGDSPFSEPVGISVTQYAPEPSLPSAMSDSLKSHPRILFPSGHETKIRQMIWEPDAKFLNIVYQQIKNYSDQLLNREPYLREGMTSVNYAREILGRVMSLSFMYRMTEMERYAVRAEREMLAVADHYADWRPSHFLTTSELTLAFAIGYDWLYDFLSDESKQIISEAIISKGLKASETASYRHSVGNWNSVCNAGVISGALAVFELMPQKCEAYITEAIQNNRKAVETFGPHGGYPEGYTYWHYGTSYQTILFETLYTALGYESNLPDNTPGFDKTGAFPMMMMTPTGACYSFADVSIGADVGCAEFWLARHFNHPEWLYLDKKLILEEGWQQKDMLWRFNPLILIYSVGLDVSAVTRPEENIWFSDGNQPLFVYRSGFDSKDDVYLGVKGGYPKQGHSHMDGGAFYYERDGVIWSGDLGSDSYLLPGHSDMGQNGGRWDIFRYSLSGHSTIFFDDAEQIVDAKSYIKEYFDDEKVGAVVDLTPACANEVDLAERTVCLEEDVLHVIDKVVPKRNMEATWNMITKASAEISEDGNIILSSEGKQMLLEALTVAQAQPYVLPAEGSEQDAPNPDYLRVGFKVALNGGVEQEIHVRVVPIN